MRERNGGLARRGIERQRVRIDVGEDRRRARQQDTASPVYAGRQRGHDHLVAWLDVDRAQQRARWRRYRCRRRPRDAAPRAAANSASNASTSGPSTNQPRAITRSMAGRTRGVILARAQIDEMECGPASQARDLLSPVVGT